jgi:hypothetical protein
MAESKQYLLPKTEGRYVTVPVTETNGAVYRINDDGTRRIYADYFVKNGNLDLKPSTFSSQEFQRNLSQSSQEYNRTISNSILEANGQVNSQPDPNQPGVQGSSVPTNTDSNGSPTAPSASGSILRYPLNNTGSYDYLQITTYKRASNITSSAALNNSGSGFDLKDPDELSTEKTNDPVVILPMQPGISDSNSVSWGPDSLSPLQLVGARGASVIMENASSGKFGEAASEFFNVLKSAAGDALNDITAEDIKAYFAGRAVGSNIFTRATGKVINPNLELLFGGPQLRIFSYNYKFTPRDPGEARVVRSIIRHFKKNMAVRRSNSGLFLETPYIFDLKYIYSSGGQHPFLNKIKKCALTDLNVGYTPDGSYMTYKDGSMTSYSVSMTFAELSPIYAEDYKSTEDMGY